MRIIYRHRCLIGGLIISLESYPINNNYGGIHAQQTSYTIWWLGKMNPLLPLFLLSAHTAYNTYTAHTANTAWGGPKNCKNTWILLDWPCILHYPCCCCLLEYTWCGQKRSLWTMLQTWLEIGIWWVVGHFKDGRAGISASKNLDDNVDPISPVGFLIQDLKGLQDICWWLPSQISKMYYL